MNLCIPLFKRCLARHKLGCLYFHSTHRYLSFTNKLENSIKTSRIKSSCSEIAFGFDIDGVLLRGSTPIPGASKTLKLLQSNNIPFILLTNGGGKLEKERAADLSEKLEVSISEENFVQSHTPFREFVGGTPSQVALQNQTILVIGGYKDKCREVALQYGFKNVVTPADILMEQPKIWPNNQIFLEHYKLNHKPLPLPINPNELSNCLKIDAILVFNDPRDWALDIQIIIDLLLSHEGYLGTYSKKNGDQSLPNHGWQQDKQPSLYFSNPDLFWAASYDLPRLGQGGFLSALDGVWRAVTGNAHLDRTVIGKPCSLTFDYAEQVLKQHFTHVSGCQSSNLKEVWFVGDNPLTDIKGANEFKSRSGIKWQSILVTTGLFKKGSSPEYNPNMIASDVKEAVENVVNSKMKLSI